MVTSAPTAPALAGAGPEPGFAAGFGEVDASSSCHASDVLTYVQGSYQPAATPTGACLGADGGELWDDFYASCLGPDKSSDKCTDYKQTPENAACAACVLTPYTAPELGPILDFGEFVGLNVAGCIEIAAPSDPSCPKAVQALSDCEIAACQVNCPVNSPMSLEDRQKCALEADEAGCATFLQMASTCQSRGEGRGARAAPCDERRVLGLLRRGGPPVLRAGDGGGRASPSTRGPPTPRSRLTTASTVVSPGRRRRTPAPTEAAMAFEELLDDDPDIGLLRVLRDDGKRRPGDRSPPAGGDGRPGLTAR